jgi:tetratricopeptide (TPR) repeat protein
MDRTHWKTLCIGVVVTSMLFLVTSCGFIKSLVGGDPEPSPPAAEQPTPQPTEIPAVELPEPEPPNTDEVVQKGIAQLENGRLNEAIASFEEALSIEPDNAQASQYLAEAKSQREQVIKKHLLQGIEFFRNEELEQAMAEWDAVLALDPNNAEALKNKEETRARLDALGK